MERVAETVKSTCCYCGVGCGVKVQRYEKGRLEVSGDETHPANRGMLCSKGRHLHHAAMDRSDRILTPRLRRRRGVPHRALGWDEALGHAASVFRRIIAEHGPDAVGLYASGQMLTEEYYVANKLVKGFFGTNNIDTNSRLCMSAAVVAYKKVLGDDAPPISYEDLEHGRCFLIAGANPAWCHPILFRRLEAHKARHPDVRVIVVDPRRTATCALADLHLQIHPGTDVTLFNAIAKYLLAHDLVDRDFIEAHTEGIESLRNNLVDVSIDAAADRCGVTAEDVRRAAQWIGETPAFTSMWAMGLNQSAAGVDKNLALLNLSLLSGQIGKPGAGPFSLTGQPNAMGGREVGGMASLLAAHRDLANPVHREEVAAFWGSGPIAAEPGLTATEMFDALEAGRMKAIWIICTNPAVTVSQLKRVEAALSKAEFVVVQDISERSDTVAFADLVLPAAGWLEKQGTMTSSERRITYLPKLIDPPGEAVPDLWILCRFAEKMGWGAFFDYADESDVFDEHRRLTRGTRIDISGVSYARLKRERSVQWPCPGDDHPGTPRLFGDGRFWTPSGRARLHAVAEDAPAVPPDSAFPLVLTTGRLRDQWHTRTKTGKVVRLNRHEPVPRLEIHPDDAVERGIDDGAVAEIASRQGALRVKVAVRDDIKPGVVFLPMHWGKSLNDGRANRLTSARVDPASKQPDYKYTAVQVRKAVKARERIVVVGAGAAARQFVETYRSLNGQDELRILGREPHHFYNRILLPDYVAGERDWASLGTMQPDEAARLDLQLHLGVEIARIDRKAREVEDVDGRRYPYDKLLLCTGSRAFVPPGVPIDWDGVDSLRTRHDGDRIRSALFNDGAILIMGGGLLGLELAAALHAAGHRCAIIEMAPRLMHRQLDSTASELLREELENRGIAVFCEDFVTEYLGEGRITGVRTKAGRRLKCDLLVVAVGTRPNTELAQTAGLECGRGVTVNEHLQTSDPAIYAAGEIAEFRGALYGITAVAQQQADVAAAHIAGDDWTVYEGSLPFSILKIHGLDVCAAGDVPVSEAGYEEVVFMDRSRRRYKRCVIDGDRLIGTVMVGDKSGFDEMRSLIASGIDLAEKRDTLLLATAEAAEPPIGRIVCSCNNVGVGNLENAVQSGCTRFDELCARTRAGTGCGSCRPEVRSILERVGDLQVRAAAKDPGNLEVPEGADDLQSIAI